MKTSKVRAARRSKFAGTFDRFLDRLVDQGDVNVAGAKGTGKTTLAFAILEELLHAGFIKGVISNIGVDLPMLDITELLPPGYNWPWRQRGIEDGGYLVDEAARVLDNRNSMHNPTDFGLYGRKLRCIGVYASYIPIDKRYTRMQVIPVEKIGGIWTYQWALVDEQGELKDSGKFRMLTPAAYYGRFDTHATPQDDAEILSLIRATVAERNIDATPKQEWMVPRSYREQFGRSVGAHGLYVDPASIPSGAGEMAAVAGPWHRLQTAEEQISGGVS